DCRCNAFRGELLAFWLVAPESARFVQLVKRGYLRFDCRRSVRTARRSALRFAVNSSGVNCARARDAGMNNQVAREFADQARSSGSGGECAEIQDRHLVKFCIVQHVKIWIMRRATSCVYRPERLVWQSSEHPKNAAERGGQQCGPRRRLNRVSVA